MAFRRRRFKRKLSWFPPLGTSFSIDDTTFTEGPVTFEADVLATGAGNTIELPITFDFGTEELQDAASPVVPNLTLSDLQGSGWQLRRIVGAVHAAYTPVTVIDNVVTGENDSPPACLFSAGLMVRKVSGAASNTAGNVTVMGQDDYTDPWIWRRVWVLGQDSRQFVEAGIVANIAAGLTTRPRRAAGAHGFSSQTTFAQFPATTAGYCNSKESGYVDQKTNRIIGTDERLFITMSTKALPMQPQAAYQQDGRIFGVFDFRMLGNLRRMTNRRNASR